MTRAPSAASPEVSSAWRYRRYLLLPLIPLAAIMALVVAALMLAVLPNDAAAVVVFASWLASLWHAARLGRSGWVVAMAVVWPVLVGYWIYVGLHLDRT